jgi:hypothetical protein
VVSEGRRAIRERERAEVLARHLAAGEALEQGPLLRADVDSEVDVVAGDDDAVDDVSADGDGPFARGGCSRLAH